MISRMFKKIGNQRYEYRPRYYDSNKEALKERINVINRAKAGDRDAIKQRMRSSMRSQRNTEITAKHRAKSGVMVFGIFVILLILAFFALELYMPEVVEVMLDR
jgi:hypothetical protein